MIFTIKKNKHYSDRFIYKLLNLVNSKPYLDRYVEFNETCRYELPRRDQEDINKLFGLSLGLNHHKDSARFGWFYKQNKIHLYSYVYDNGERFYEFIAKLDLNKKYHLNLVTYENRWEFWVLYNDKFVAIKKVNKRKPFCLGYKLWPYFGGNNPAPHDIEILIECT